MVSYKKMLFLNILKNLLESTCTKAFALIKMSEAYNLNKKRLCHRCFSVNFAKFLRTPFSLGDCF